MPVPEKNIRAQRSPVSSDLAPVILVGVDSDGKSVLLGTGDDAVEEVDVGSGGFLPVGWGVTLKLSSGSATILLESTSCGLAETKAKRKVRATSLSISSETK
ncbi:hypothetical protein GCK72_017564 [Caenorhabditis remanei]|uniref:Uncharacterized protein n=1 Tax=Caenorhabditis remanei TaxID=31234 RepID=A0A6A5G8U9_CAERE|nr:hypothetical protein GCK72_017564 [Caenorhabditis remanei]KAF1751012.1 hypothetical protein GCK72_017564 [Caenorhabditis remanei]